MEYICRMSLIEKVERLIEVEKIRDGIDQFCRSQYKIRMANNKSNAYGFNYYTGFDVISKDKLRINYSYGAGEYEFTGSFDLDLLEFDRDSKIDEIL